MKKIYSSLAALALSVFMGSSVFAASEVKAVDEVTPAVDQLDGKILVVTDATGEYILTNASQDMRATEIATISDMSICYCFKFEKVEKEGIEGNLYNLQCCNKEGDISKHGWWKPAYLNFQPTGSTIFILGIDQDGANGSLFSVEYEEGNGYVLHNKLNNKYLNPAISNPSEEKAYVRLYEDIKKIEIFDISELTTVIDAAKAIENPTEALAAAIAEAEGVAATATTVAELDDAIAALNEAIKEDKKVKLMANPQAGDDMTLFIVNPDFETKTMDGWTQEGGLWMQNNGNLTANYAEKWSGDATAVVGASIKQTVTLPAGVYVLSADISCDNLVAEIYAGETAAEYQHQNQKPAEVEFTLAEAGEIEIGYRATGYVNAGSAGWFAIDNVKLTYKEANITTGINNVNNAVVAKNGKFISNGNIVIVKDGQKYNVAGQAIK